MRKTTLAIRKTKVKGVTYWQVTLPRLGGGRERRTFKDKRNAETFLDQSAIQQENYGTAALSISEKIRVEAVACLERLKKQGATLTQATDFYLKHIETTLKSTTIEKAIAELLKVKEGAGVSKLYLRDLKWRLGKVAGAFPERQISEITTPELQNFLVELGVKKPVGAVTLNTFRRDIRTLWGYADKRGWARKEVAGNTEASKAIQKKPAIFTPQQATSLINASKDDDILAYHAIGLFAGLRVAEIERLDWSNVDITGGYIEVTASNSKTRTRRLVPIQENLKSWLEPIAKTSGPVVRKTSNPKTKRPRSTVGTFNKTGEPESFRRRHTSTIKAAGLKTWPVNVMRHTFVSYRLAETQDAGKTALESGHDQAVLFAHYRELVKPAQAKSYWSIAPYVSEKITSIGAA